MEITQSGRRGPARRTRATLERLAAERDIWVSTAHPEHGPHQVPLWFLWDGRAVWVCTAETSVTIRNVRADPRVRLALPDTADVVTLAGRAECFASRDVPEEAAEAFTDRFGWDPRAATKPHVYVRVTPATVRAWHGVPELRGRVIMRGGEWLGRAPETA
ncbi:pyridoxamine 5'-phosphate oxidase family protein [Streptomyces candidus]|uniref:General stress protein 26 n=1 Tax=Streptomyces candidus TaxID=67283 RepID=A0A7X0LS48_9ACTN|nr:pyridoxamine 5'-phosphate oxidase family protein [Streptomyces candidus]MBB6439333.1 general stress protein 26 [Streptomyces candidus]GHH42322.1 hypothetical protein GCM10018773_26530 [Streptomyces candidus]